MLRLVINLGLSTQNIKFTWISNALAVPHLLNLRLASKLVAL